MRTESKEDENPLLYYELHDENSRKKNRWALNLLIILLTTAIVGILIYSMQEKPVPFAVQELEVGDAVEAIIGNLEKHVTKVQFTEDEMNAAWRQWSARKKPLLTDTVIPVDIVLALKDAVKKVFDAHPDCKDCLRASHDLVRCCEGGSMDKEESETNLFACEQDDKICEAEKKAAAQCEKEHCGLGEEGMEVSVGKSRKRRNRQRAVWGGPVEDWHEYPAYQCQAGAVQVGAVGLGALRQTILSHALAMIRFAEGAQVPVGGLRLPSINFPKIPGGPTIPIPDGIPPRDLMNNWRYKTGTWSKKCPCQYLYKEEENQLASIPTKGWGDIINKQIIDLNMGTTKLKTFPEVGAQSFGDQDLGVQCTGYTWDGDDSDPDITPANKPISEWHYPKEFNKMRKKLKCASLLEVTFSLAMSSKCCQISRFGPRITNKVPEFTVSWVFMVQS